MKRRAGIFQGATVDAGASSLITGRLLDAKDLLLAEGQTHDGGKKALLIGCKYSRNRNFSELELPHRDIEGVKNMLIGGRRLLCPALWISKLDFYQIPTNSRRKISQFF